MRKRRQQSEHEGGQADALGRGDHMASDLLAESIVVGAKIDAKLFGRLRLLSLEARVLTGKPITTRKSTGLIARKGTRAVNSAEADKKRELHARSSVSDLDRAVELWSLSSDVLSAIQPKRGKSGHD